MAFPPYHSNLAQQSIQHFPPGYSPATTPNAYPFVGHGLPSFSNPAASQNVPALAGPYPNTLVKASCTSDPPMSSFGRSPPVIEASNAAPHSSNLFSQSNLRNPRAIPSPDDEKPTMTPQNSSSVVFSRLISKELGRYRAINPRVAARRIPPSDRTTYAEVSSPSPNSQAYFRAITNGNANWPVQSSACQPNGPRLFGPAPFHHVPRQPTILPLVQPQQVVQHQIKHPSYLPNPQHLALTRQPIANIAIGDVNSPIEQQCHGNVSEMTPSPCVDLRGGDDVESNASRSDEQEEVLPAAPESSGSLTDLTWLTESRQNWFPLLPGLDSDFSISKDCMEYYRYGATTREAEAKESSATLIYPGDIPTAIFPRPDRVSKDGLIQKGLIDEAYQAPYEEERKDRPPIAYMHLIILAINSSPEKKMALRDIYAWIEQHFKYYKETHLEWKSSIRHKLSSYNIFVRENETLHGGLWSVNGNRNDINMCMKYKKKPVSKSTLTKYLQCTDLSQLHNFQDAAQLPRKDYASQLPKVRPFRKVNRPSYKPVLQKRRPPDELPLGVTLSRSHDSLPDESFPKGFVSEEIVFEG